MTQRQDTHTRDGQSSGRRKKELRKQACSLLLYSPPGQNSRLVWLSLLSIAHVHKCYHTAKGSEIPASCRVCPEPFLPPYHRKGMFPRLRRTIKLKAVSSLLGRISCLQARSAQAESPVCRHISAFPIVATLTLQRYEMENLISFFSWFLHLRELLHTYTHRYTISISN